MYITDLATQLKNIIPAVGLGFVLGLFYLLIRIFRVALSDSKIYIFITDVIFTVSCTLSSFLLLIAVNNGHIRLYLILAEVLGYCSFSFLFGELIFMFFQRLIFLIKRILSPLLKPLRFVNRKINEIMKKQPQNIENLKNKLKKLLKPHSQVLYNNKD